MSTLAELNAQEAAIRAAKAALNKLPMDALMARLQAAEEEALADLRALLSVVADPATMGDTEANQRAGELLNVLNLMPSLLGKISERITVEAAGAPPAA